MVELKASWFDARDGELGECSVGAWTSRHRSEFERVCDSLAGVDVVVNAAGLARPGCRETLELLYPGQSVAASALSVAGFVPPVGEADWTATAVRSPAARGPSSDAP